MKKLMLLSVCAMMLLASCVSKKEYLALEAQQKETQDLLLNVEAAQPSPQPFFFYNLDGTVLNEGVEWSINYDFFQTEDFTWNAGFNISYNKRSFVN